VTTAEKIIDVARILDSRLSVEQKLAAIRLVLQVKNAQPGRLAHRPGWQRDDDPDVRSRNSDPRPGRP
jgi:hypothetical protein